jgi:hypothetical protein
MPARARRLTAWVAILAVALQAVLVGFAAWSPAAAAATIDPTTFICHSVPPGADSGQQAPLPTTHDDCCSHCILCGSLAAVDLPTVSSEYIPPRLTALKLVPFSAVEPFVGGTSNPNLPRGPPSSFV